MYANKQIMLALAEQVLNIKACVNNDWCIHWLERIWRDEITMAICDAKRRRPRCAAEAHADLLS